MEVLLDDGKALKFGDKLEDIESLLSCQAIGHPARIVRQSIDKFIHASNVSLSFDTGRLKDIKFKEDYQFVNPPTPYPEQWKNFPPIGPHKISKRMPRDNFLAYVAVWEERAIQLGATKVEFGDLTSQQFAVSQLQLPDLDCVQINMGPARRANGGGIWCDGWGANFTMDKQGGQASGEKIGSLRCLTAFRDEFNTRARKC